MSQQKDTKPNVSAAVESAVETLVCRVLRATGRIVPQTAEEVAEAEAIVDESTIELPSRLRHPPAGPCIAADGVGDSATPLPHTEAAEALARAARNGKQIPPEVLERMQSDRRQAESEPDADE
jgi:hypothetical protein